MKLSSALIVAAYAQQDDKKVPPRHPLQRLERLVEFGEEIMNDWFEFLPSKMNWQNKFRKNADRMTLAFTRCGYYDENLMPHGGPEESGDRKRRDTVTLEDLLRSSDRYDREDPVVGVRQITTGFKKWAIRYIGNCSGQRLNEYQINRMERWNSKLQGHLDSYYGDNKIMNVM